MSLDVHGEQCAMYYVQSEDNLRRLAGRRLGAWRLMQVHKLQQIMNRLETIKSALIGSAQGAHAEPRSMVSAQHASGSSPSLDLSLRSDTNLWFRADTMNSADLRASGSAVSTLEASTARGATPVPPDHLDHLRRSDEVDVGVSTLVAAGFGEKEAAAALVACGAGSQYAQNVMGARMMHHALTLLLKVQLGLESPSRLRLSTIARTHSIQRVPETSRTYELLAELYREQQVEAHHEQAETVSATDVAPSASASASMVAQASPASMPPAGSFVEPEPSTSLGVGKRKLASATGGGRTDPAASSIGGVQSAPEAAKALDGAGGANDGGEGVCGEGEEAEEASLANLKQDVDKLREKGLRAFEARLMKLRDPYLFTAASHQPPLARVASGSHTSSAHLVLPSAPPSVGPASILRLIAQVLLSHTFEWLALAMLTNHCINADVLSMIFPLSLLLYGLLDSPRPAPAYFDVMLSYTLVLISVKFLYQLPIFCGSPAFHFRSTYWPASNKPQSDDAYCYDPSAEHDQQFLATLTTRIDYVVGIHKFTRRGSLDKLGTFLALLPDLVVLAILIAHRQVLRARGEQISHAHIVSMSRRQLSVPASRLAVCWGELRAFGHRLLPPLNEAKRGTDQHIQSFVICRKRCSHVPAAATLATLLSHPSPPLSLLPHLYVTTQPMPARTTTPSVRSTPDALPATLTSLAVILFVFILAGFSALPKQPEATCAAASLASQLSNSQIDLPTVIVVWMVISVMMFDRFIYRKWEPPTAVDTEVTDRASMVSNRGHSSAPTDDEQVRGEGPRCEVAHLSTSESGASASLQESSLDRVSAVRKRAKKRMTYFLAHVHDTAVDGISSLPPPALCMKIALHVTLTVLLHAIVRSHCARREAPAVLPSPCVARRP
jgi:hypothetical protein